MRIYIAAPLFSEGERAFNEKVDAVVRECGHETFLPQREGGCVADLPAEIDGMPVGMRDEKTFGLIRDTYQEKLVAECGKLL